MNAISCTTKEIKQLTDQIFRVRIQPESGELFDFNGGQYLMLILDEEKKIPLSIASAPEETSFIELHIRYIPNFGNSGGGVVDEMLALFRSDKTFQIEGPFGRCYLQDGENDIVIIAGGTGFSPMKSMVESALNKNEKRNFHFYLGVQKEFELYQPDLVKPLEDKYDGFNFVPVVGEPTSNWEGEKGFPHEVVLSQFKSNLNNLDFYLSGSEPMVVNVYKALIAEGVPSEQIRSDMLDIIRDRGEEI